jgi:hypothetical protein
MDIIHDYSFLAEIVVAEIPPALMLSDGFVVFSLAFDAEPETKISLFPVFSFAAQPESVLILRVIALEKAMYWCGDSSIAVGCNLLRVDELTPRTCLFILDYVFNVVSVLVLASLSLSGLVFLAVDPYGFFS